MSMPQFVEHREVKQYRMKWMMFGRIIRMWSRLGLHCHDMPITIAGMVIPNQFTDIQVQSHVKHNMILMIYKTVSTNT